MSAPEHEIPTFQIKFTKVCLINIHTSEIKHVDCTDLNDFIENFPSDDYKQQRSSWKIFYAVPVTDHDSISTYSQEELDIMVGYTGIINVEKEVNNG